MSRPAAVLFVLLASLLGCASSEPSVDMTVELDPSALNPDGIVFIVPGVSGGIIGGRMVKAELVNAGCPYAIELYDWSRGVTEKAEGRRPKVEGRTERACACGSAIDLRP
jgi:hypothetical protein